VNCNGCSGVRINELKSIELSEYDHNISTDNATRTFKATRGLEACARGGCCRSR